MLDGTGLILTAILRLRGSGIDYRRYGKEKEKNSEDTSGCLTQSIARASTSPPPIAPLFP